MRNKDAENAWKANIDSFGVETISQSIEITADLTDRSSFFDLESIPARAGVNIDAFQFVRLWRSLATDEMRAEAVFSRDSIGDTSCAYNAQSPYLRCAVNPEGPCQDCACREEL